MMVGAKPTDGRPVEDVVIRIPLPSHTSAASLIASYGTAIYDEKSKECTWTIGRCACALLRRSPLISSDLRASLLASSNPSHDPHCFLLAGCHSNALYVLLPLVSFLTLWSLLNCAPRLRSPSPLHHALLLRTTDVTLVPAHLSSPLNPLCPRTHLC